MKGHKHTDRSRERRYNSGGWHILIAIGCRLSSPMLLVSTKQRDLIYVCSGKSDDSSYPVIKTPSREDAVNLSDSDNDLANLKNNIMKETEMPL